MRYHTSRIKEIQDELKELREDGDNNEYTVTALKKEINESQKEKKDTYQKWRVVKDS